MIVNAEEIKSAAKLTDILSFFQIAWKKNGAGFIAPCPKCGEDRKGKGLKIKANNEVGTCYQCDTSFNSVIAVAEIKKLDPKNDFAEILTLLAEITSTPIHYDEAKNNREPKKEEKPKTSKTTKTKSDTTVPSTKGNKRVKEKSFRDQQLEASGITNAAQKAWRLEVGETEDKTKKVEVDLFYSGSRNEAGEIEPGDDMVIRKLDLNRHIRTFLKPKGKTGGYYKDPVVDKRIRHRVPEHHLDRYNNPMKYWSPAGSHAAPFHPEPVLHAFERKIAIETYHIDEGEKKSVKRNMHGMVGSGIMGIHNLAKDKQLHTDFAEIIRVNKVKNVVFTMDADWEDIQSNPEKPIDGRARSFYSAVKKYQQYFIALAASLQVDLNIYIAFINKNEHDEKGVDDLLAGSLKGIEHELKEDYKKAMLNQPSGEGKYVTCVDITDYSSQKLLKLFHLSSRDEFVLHHMDTLLNRRTDEEKKEHMPVTFIFGNTKWSLDEKKNIQLAQPLAPEEIFWTESYSKRTGTVSYEIDFNKQDVFFINHNIGRILVSQKHEDYKYELVRIDPKTKTVELQSPKQIRDFVLAYLKEIEEFKIFNYLRKVKTPLNDDTLEEMPFIDDTFTLLKASIDRQNLFFVNAFWLIDSNEIKAHSIADSTGYVWAKQIIDRNIELDSIPLLNVEKKDNGLFNVEFSEAGQQCHFLQFLYNTGNFHWLEEKSLREDLKKTEDETRIKSINESLEKYKAEQDLHLINKMTAFGYLCHEYFNAALVKAIVFNDGKDSSIGESNGRAGKGIVADALEHVLNMVRLDGQNIDFKNDKFIYANVTEQTRVICFDDISPSFRLENIFMVMMGHVSQRALHKAAQKIRKEKTPHFLILTNHSLLGNSDSHLDRVHNCIFSDFYNAKHKPIDDFKVRFFDDWEEGSTQWKLFFHCVAHCIQLYLKYGLVVVGSDMVRKRQLRLEMGEAFLNWMDDYFTVEMVDKETNRIPFNQNLRRDDMQQAFYAKNPSQKKFVSSHKFREKVQAWCEYHGYIYNVDQPYFDKKDPSKNSPHGGRIVPGGFESFRFGPPQGFKFTMPDPNTNSGEEELDDMPF